MEQNVTCIDVRFIYFVKNGEFLNILKAEAGFTHFASYQCIFFILQKGWFARMPVERINDKLLAVHGYAERMKFSL
jgi:hypothetical protein